jgi:hypothetical protein
MRSGFARRRAATVDASDRSAIEALLAAREDAIRARDRDGYRPVLGAFHCDKVPEDERMRDAEREANGDDVRTHIVEILDLGLKNVRHAAVRFVEERRGEPRKRVASLERYPIGWRIVSIE